MSTRGPLLHGLTERLQAPLVAPVLSALLAYAGWQAAAVLGQHTLLVAARPIPAGAQILPADVRLLPWRGPLPQNALPSARGYARLALAAGVPLLADEVTALPPAQPRLDAVGLPGGAIFAAPPLGPGDIVSVFYLSPQGRLESVVATATVAQANQQGLSLRLDAQALPALFAAAAGGRLVIVRVGP